MVGTTPVCTVAPTTTSIIPNAGAGTDGTGATGATGAGVVEVDPSQCTDIGQDCQALDGESMSCAYPWEVVDLQRCRFNSNMNICEFTCRRQNSCLPNAWLRQNCDVFLLENSTCNGAQLPSVAGLCWNRECTVKVGAD